AKPDEGPCGHWTGRSLGKVVVMLPSQPSGEAPASAFGAERPGGATARTRKCGRIPNARCSRGELPACDLRRRRTGYSAVALLTSSLSRDRVDFRSAQADVL